MALGSPHTIKEIYTAKIINIHVTLEIPTKFLDQYGIYQYIGHVHTVNSVTIHTTPYTMPHTYEESLRLVGHTLKSKPFVD